LPVEHFEHNPHVVSATFCFSGEPWLSIYAIALSSHLVAVVGFPVEGLHGDHTLELSQGGLAYIILLDLLPGDICLGRLLETVWPRSGSMGRRLPEEAGQESRRQEYFEESRKFQIVTSLWKFTSFHMQVSSIRGKNDLRKVKKNRIQESGVSPSTVLGTGSQEKAKKRPEPFGPGLSCFKSSSRN
jgi:hypothetical protein